MADITTQAQIEELENNPSRFDDYIKAKALEISQGNEKNAQMQRNIFPVEDDSKSDGWKSAGEYFGALHATNRGIYDPRLKALNEAEGDQGGFLVPEEFRNTLLSIALEQSVIRPRATPIPMASNTVRIPYIRDASHASTVFGGVRGYWDSEAATATESEPTFAQLQLTAKKLVGYTVVSNELLADSAIALEALLQAQFGAALAYFEDDAFINGDGAGEPLGILNADALVTVAKETGQAATTLTYQNVLKMYSRMLPTSLSRAVWIMHPDTFPQLAQMSMSVGTGGSPVFIANAVGGAPTSLFGRPIIFSEKAQTLGTKGDVYFADLSYYLIGDRQSLTAAASPHVKFTTDQTVYRFIKRLDGRPWLDTAITPRNGSNTLSPFVALAARS